MLEFLDQNEKSSVGIYTYIKNLQGFVLRLELLLSHIVPNINKTLK